MSIFRHLSFTVFALVVVVVVILHYYVILLSSQVEVIPEIKYLAIDGVGKVQ